MTEEEILKVFQAFRVMQEDSMMTETRVYRKNAGSPAGFSSTFWGTRCTYPVASLAVIKELKAKITPLTQDLIIVKASRSELPILGTTMIYMKAEVLGEDRKKLEVAVIVGQEGSKEILVSLKLMKVWNVVHQSFPRESANSYIQR